MVLQTSVQEGFGLTALEASEQGKPLILRRLPLVTDWLEQSGGKFPHSYSSSTCLRKPCPPAKASLGNNNGTKPAAHCSPNLGKRRQNAFLPLAFDISAHSAWLDSYRCWKIFHHLESSIRKQIHAHGLAGHPDTTNHSTPHQQCLGTANGCTLELRTHQRRLISDTSRKPLLHPPHRCRKLADAVVRLQPGPGI